MKRPVEKQQPEPTPKPKGGKRAARTTMCPHRVPPTAFCKRGCDG